MYYVLYMCIVFGVVYLVWIFLLSFQKCIVLNSAVFLIRILYFGYTYRVLDKCVVL